MTLKHRISLFFLIGFLLAGCSARQNLKAQVKLIQDPENRAFDTYTACGGYLELLGETYEPDMQAFEACLDNSIESDGTLALRFCRLLADSGESVPAALQEKCVAGAETYVRGDLRNREYDQARDKFLKAVAENMPFVNPQEVRRVAEKIDNTRYIDQSQDLLIRIALAADQCKVDGAPVEEFRQIVQTHALNDAIQERLAGTIQRMTQDIDRKIGEGRVDCAKIGMIYLAGLTAGGPVPDAAGAEVAARLPAWLDAGVERLDRGEYMDAFSLLRGVQALAQVQGDTGAVDETIAGLVDRFAHQPQSRQAIQDQVSYLCTQEGIRLDPGYQEILKMVFELNFPVKGKYLNCTGVSVSEELLPTSLAELRYVVSATSAPTPGGEVARCEYSGGHTLEYVPADYQITVTEIGSGKVVAETSLPSVASIDCEWFRTFISKVDRYHLPLEAANLTSWLASLDLP